MYCIRCGVRLADTEKQCPLCRTPVCHPDFPPCEGGLYPKNAMPEDTAETKHLNGVILILFLIPALGTLLLDMHADRTLDWAGYVLGTLLVTYVAVALPLWFSRPNPVIFVPCTFAAVTLFLFYISVATKSGDWFLPFALPVTGGLCLICCTVVTLLRYLRHGRLYIWGGALMALGGLALLTEFLAVLTFSVPFIGWSIYPLTVLFMVGALLVYLGIDRRAREMMERKLFF